MRLLHKPFKRFFWRMVFRSEPNPHDPDSIVGILWSVAVGRSLPAKRKAILEEWIGNNQQVREMVENLTDPAWIIDQAHNLGVSDLTAVRSASMWHNIEQQINHN